jgi:hypothetical protein
MRDGYGPRTLETLVRYRGSALAELFRGLGALRTLQTEMPGLLEAGRYRTNPRKPLESIN